MYEASNDRYDRMKYQPCGKSGLKLPVVSLGLWHNFGDNAHYENMKALCFTAFDHGITHFDLANNYGPAPGAAERNFGKILAEELGAYRDELIISTKAGYDMWPGPYGNGGSRKYLIASLDQSLIRMGLGYVDIFYHHRPDPETPLEETMLALDSIVKSGKALYAGLSNYNGEQMLRAAKILRELHCPYVINQNAYNILNRTVEENGALEMSQKLGKGMIAYCPLAQGVLTDRYLNGIPNDSRVMTDGRFLNLNSIQNENMERILRLHELAGERGESLAQMALKWVLRDGGVTSVLIGASKPQQIIENLGVMNKPPLSGAELRIIDDICAGRTDRR